MMRGAKTFSTKTFSIVDLIVTLSISIKLHYAQCHNPKCRVAPIVMLNVILLSVVTPNVAIL